MTQEDFTGIYCARPQNFAWFLGAGSSRTAGLPTANDVLWDLKRRYYCREENQKISRQDIQNEAVRARIQQFMESRGFPEQGAEAEYATYFEKVFGDDTERQRKYLHAILSEDNVSLSIGHRVFGALLASGLCRAAFTTNFDSVIEKAVAEVSGRSLSAYHLEGPHAANEALNNEEYPLYCKLHGDFRYDSLKNLPEDLATQNDALSRCLVNAGNRFGFIVAGYSGRDNSVMKLFHRVLESNNPFPHGLFWTGIKGSRIPPMVDELLDQARAKGVNARFVPIETFDALLLRLWRNIEDKSPELEAKVHKTQLSMVSIPLPGAGQAKPIIRLNALPIVSYPQQCLKLSFKTAKDWNDIKRAQRQAKGNIFLTKSDTTYCWGQRNQIEQVFSDDRPSIKEADLPADLNQVNNLHFKGFIEQALCAALVRDKPLLSRHRHTSFVIVDAQANDQSALDRLKHVTESLSGIVEALTAPATEQHPEPEKVRWAEAARVSVDSKNGTLWLVIDPDIWIWPPRAREVAAQFLRDRRRDRFNEKYNTLLDAWVTLLVGTRDRDTEVTVSAFDTGTGSENPAFRLRTRTAYTRRLK